MSNSGQSSTVSQEEVKRAENIQIVVATAIVSAYVALTGKGEFPKSFLTDLFIFAVLLSSLFLVLKMIALTMLAYPADLPKDESGSSINTFLSTIDDFGSKLLPNWYSNLRQLSREVDQSLIPLLYMLSLTIVILYIPFFAATQLLPGQVATMLLQLTSDPYFQGLFFVILAPIVMLMAARFLLSYRATMAQIESGSVPGSVFVASGSSGSNREFTLRNLSESRTYEAGDIRLKVDQPSGVRVGFEAAREIEDGLWEVMDELRPGEKIILFVNFQRTSEDVTGGEEVQISVMFEGEIEVTETYSLDL